MCSRVPYLEYSGQAGDLAVPHECRFNGDGSTSYTAWMRNLMRCGSVLHMSAKATLLSSAFSHLVQDPCCFIPTALQVLISSTEALISSWTRQRLAFPLMVSVCIVGKDPSSALPRVTTPTSLLWHSLASASWTASSALYSSPHLDPCVGLLRITGVPVLHHISGSWHLELLL